MSYGGWSGSWGGGRRPALPTLAATAAGASLAAWLLRPGWRPPGSSVALLGSAGAGGGAAVSGGDHWRRTALLGLAAAGASLAVWLLRRGPERNSQQQRPRRPAYFVANQECVGQVPARRVVVVESASEWRDVSGDLMRGCSDARVLGFDCEWVAWGGDRQPVALLQLATLDGLCVLVRLCQMVGGVPEDLQALLKDRSVLKVGVACHEDAALLLADHGVTVRGCLDLRLLASRHPDQARLLKRPGLAGLAHSVLGVRLNKERALRCSDWEAPQLSAAQQEYAADDALVGVLLFCALLKHRVDVVSAASWPRVLAACQGLVDRKYQRKQGMAPGEDLTVEPPPAAAVRCAPRAAPTSYQRAKRLDRAYSLRKSRLYDNARLLAPDGQPLSVVENTKARWYVEKGLGDVVQEEPLIVKLRFEPAGRPQMEGQHGRYYLQEKINCCVRCGASDGYVKKNIVPQEYRKHFPGIMKSHQSHDVLLMCLACHQESNILDLSLRQRLAEECSAPIGTETDVKMHEDKALRRVKSAGRALLKSREKLPPERAAELETVLQEYYGVAPVTDDILQDALNMNTNRRNDDYVSHGEAVYRHYCAGDGLTQLERRWRQHFLDTMRPAHLPPLWSVEHNHAKIRWKIRRAKWPPAVKADVWRRCFGSEYDPDGGDGDDDRPW